MRVAITGDRNWKNYQTIYFALASLPHGSTVVLGDARGADALACKACLALGLRHVDVADWQSLGRAAGPVRNGRMLDNLREGDEVWYFHDDLSSSKGTANCVSQARARGLTVRDGRRIT